MTSAEATALIVSSVDVGTGSQELLHDGVAAKLRRAMQWRLTSGTRREMPILEDVSCFAAKARWWKLVKERFVFPLQILTEMEVFISNSEVFGQDQCVISVQELLEINALEFLSVPWVIGFFLHIFKHDVHG